MDKNKSTPFKNKLLPAVFIIFIACLPLIFSKQLLDQVLLPRQMLLGIFLLIVSVILLVKRIKIDIDLNLFTACIILLPVVYIFSAFQSIEMAESFATITKIVLLHTFILLSYSLFKSQLLGINAVCKGVFIFNLVAIGQTIFDLSESAGTDLFQGNAMYTITAGFANKNLLSSILLLCLPFLFILLRDKNKKWQIGVLFLLLIDVVLIILLQTRAVYLGIAAACLLCLPLLPLIWPGQKKRLLLFVGIPVFLTIMAAGIFVLKKGDSLGTLTRSESVNERIALWDNTVQMIADNPLLGVGAGNWQVHFPAYGLEKFYLINYHITGGYTTFQRPHNDFLWVWAETGLIGFLIYIMIFAASLFYCFRLAATDTKHKLVWVCVLFSILAYIFIALADFPMERVEHQVLLGLLVAWVAASYIGKKSLSGITRFLQPTTFLILVSACLIITGYRFNGEKHARKMAEAHIRGNWQMILSEEKKASGIFYDMDPFSIPLQWYVGVAHFSSGKLPEAKAAFIRAYQLHPYQVHVINNYAGCLEKEGNHTDAIKLYEKMLQISPQFAEGILNASAAYYNAGQYENAYKTICTFRYDESSEHYKSYLATILGEKLRMLAEEKQHEAIQGDLLACAENVRCIIESYKESLARNIPFDLYILKKLSEQNLNS